MLARRKAKLPFYLNALREKEYAEKYPGCLLNNFHNLLRFWQRHYLNKDKDSTCLENVSSSFLHTVEAMLNTPISPKSKTAALQRISSPMCESPLGVYSLDSVTSLSAFQNILKGRSHHTCYENKDIKCIECCSTLTRDVR